MSLKRSLLNGMGLTEEQVNAIIEAHSETVAGLKAEIEKYREDAEQLSEVKKELESLKSESTDNGEWESKYKNLSQEFEDFKAKQSEKEIENKKIGKYKEQLVDAGVPETLHDGILRTLDTSKIELDDDGNLVGKEDVLKSIKTDWEKFIPIEQTEGAKTVTPPANVGGSQYATKAEIMAIQDGEERRRAIKENPQLFVK